MATPVKPWALVRSAVIQGGTPVIAAYGPALGGFIQNPVGARDQGLAVVENLYVDPVGPAATMTTATTVSIQPGGRFNIPANFAGKISVNAASAGHRFGGIVLQPPPGFQPSTNPFPPSAPTTMVSLGKMASYLYQQYSDDDDLQAFVAAFNLMANQYVDWFATVDLPVYSGLTGSLLDWVAQGLYGQIRPVVTTGLPVLDGPYNTVRYNVLRFNEVKNIAPPGYFPASDDVFQRCITWNFYKGDGKVFDVRWLKRRVMRFLTGTNGGGGTTDTTYPVSVTFGADGQIDINLQSTRIYATGGSFFNIPQFNRVRFNSISTRTVMQPVSPLAIIFKACMQAGVLQFPWQYQPVVNIN